jgi:hypothetical protein
VLPVRYELNWYIRVCYAEESRPPLWSGGQSSWLQNGDILCFLWGTNWIYICYVEESRPPLWSSGHSSWLEIQRSGLDTRRYQIFWEVMGLERGPLSFVSTTEKLLGRKHSRSGLENRKYGRGDTLHWPRDTLYPQKLAPTSLTSGDRSDGIVFSRTQATEISFSLVYVRNTERTEHQAKLHVGGTLYCGKKPDFRIPKRILVKYDIGNCSTVCAHF